MPSGKQNQIEALQLSFYFPFQSKSHHRRRANTLESGTLQNIRQGVNFVNPHFGQNIFE
jgi:hypothetical protein